MHEVVAWRGFRGVAVGRANGGSRRRIAQAPASMPPRVLRYLGDSAKANYALGQVPVWEVPTAADCGQRPAALSAGARRPRIAELIAVSAPVDSSRTRISLSEGLNGLGCQGSSGSASDWPTIPEGDLSRGTLSSELTETKGPQPQLHFSDRSRN